MQMKREREKKKARKGERFRARRNTVTINFRILQILFKVFGEKEKTISGEREKGEPDGGQTLRIFWEMEAPGGRQNRREGRLFFLQVKGQVEIGDLPRVSAIKKGGESATAEKCESYGSMGEEDFRGRRHGHTSTSLFIGRRGRWPGKGSKTRAVI